MNKEILTVEDLLNFCESKQFEKFSSNETGYKIAVKIPTTFETIENVDKNHKGMTKLKFRIFHDGLNRNKSYVSHESAEKAMSTIPDRPVLAAIHQLDDGSYDFEGHETKTITHEDGTQELVYIESQVGSFSSEPAFWEHDDDLDKDYVCAYAYISNTYTKAVDIINSKGGTKNSCELCIEEFSYNASEKYLDLIDFYVSGSTLLGKRNDGQEIGEGMIGSRADIADFSLDNNSIINYANKLDLLTSKVDILLSRFNDIDSTKGGNSQMNKFEELLKSYNKTIDEIEFEYEGLSDEELEVKFAEVFGESNQENEIDEPKNVQIEETIIEDNNAESSDNAEEITDSSIDSTQNLSVNENETDDSNTGSIETEACGNKSDDDEKKKNNSIDINGKNFSLSLSDVQWDLYELVNETYSEVDNTWYGCDVYLDGYVIMHDLCTGNHYKQSYISENDNYSLVGDRVEVYAEYLTDSELESLKEMRANYSSIKSQLEKYQNEESDADKMTLFEDSDYTQFLDTDLFKRIMDKDFIRNHSKEEIDIECKLAFANLVKLNKTFSLENNNNTRKSNSVKIFSDFNTDEKSPYGDYFKSLGY